MATLRKAQARAAISELVDSFSLPVLLIVAAVVVGVAALLPLVQSSGATSTAGQIQQLEQERTDWQARLRELELEVASLGSLDRIDKEARTRLSMEPPQEMRYLSIDAAPPEKRKLPSRFLPPEHQQIESGSSLWEGLFGWILP